MYCIVRNSCTCTSSCSRQEARAQPSAVKGKVHGCRTSCQRYMLDVGGKAEQKVFVYRVVLGGVLHQTTNHKPRDPTLGAHGLRRRLSAQVGWGEDREHALAAEPAHMPVGVGILVPVVDHVGWTPLRFATVVETHNKMVGVPARLVSVALKDHDLDDHVTEGE